MSASDLRAPMLDNASTLWITDRPRALAALFAAVLVFSPAAAFEMSEPWRMFAGATVGAEASADAKLVAGLAKAAASGGDIVLMVGGSTAREFTGSDDYLSRALSQRCRREINFVNAGSSSQTIADTWRITFAMPPERLKLVISGMNYLRFEEGFAQVRNSASTSALPLPHSRALASSLSHFGQPVPFAIPGLGKTAWLLAHRGEMAADQPATLRPARDDVGAIGIRNLYRAPALTPEEKRLIVTRMTIERSPQYLRNRGESVRLWREFVAHLKKQGGRTEFLILPESASMAPIDRRLGSLLLADVRASATPDAGFTDWRHLPDLSEEDFFDQQHLLASGRAKLAGPFVTFVAQRLGNCGA